MTDLLLGQVLSFTADPFAEGPSAARIDEALVIEGGRIAAVGAADALRRQYPQARVTDYGRHLVSACFIDSLATMGVPNTGYGGLHRRACALSANGHHRQLGQASDRLAEYVYLP